MADFLTIPLILDVVILVLLIATIVYAVRLTGYLKRFKESRADLEHIIKELSVHINKADNAMSELNEAVDISADDLQKRMDRAYKMFDELEIVVQSGDSLASRLEDLAVRNRKIIEGGEGDMADLMRHSMKDEDTYQTRLEHVVKQTDDKRQNEQARPVFSIRDTDMERGEDFDSGFSLEDNELLSDAERDLYNALKGTKKLGGGQK